MKIDRNGNLILATYLVGDKIWWAGHVFCILHSAKRTDRPVEPTRLSCRQGWGTWRNSNLSSTTRLGYSRPRYYRRWIDSKHITFIPFSAKLLILSVLEIQHYSCFAGRARDRRVVISTYPPVHGESPLVILHRYCLLGPGLLSYKVCQKDLRALGFGYRVFTHKVNPNTYISHEIIRNTF